MSTPYIPRKRSEDSIWPWSLSCTLFEARSLISWPISFSWHHHLPPHHRSTRTADACYCAQLYVLSGDLNSGPPTSVASNFSHLGFDLVSKSGLESHMVYKQKTLSVKSFYNIYIIEHYLIVISPNH